MSEAPPARSDLQRILESSRRLGVEMDEAEALQWLGAMAAGSSGDIVVDTRAGVFGHKVSMLDFAPQDLDRFRAIGRIVEIPDEAGVVEGGDAAGQPVEAARAQVINVVNNFFHGRLTAVPTIGDDIAHHQAGS